MKKTRKSSLLNTPVPFIQLSILAFILILGGMVIAEDILKSPSVLGSSNKAKNVNSNSSSKKIEKADVRGVKANQHLIRVQNIVLSLDNISEPGEVEEEIEVVKSDIEDNTVTVAESLEQIESRPAWKSVLLGTDYKNLGQLRSTLVRTDNAIRKLSRTREMVQGEENSDAIQAQIGELEQERERIRTIIEENEESFSILGWVFRFLTGYSKDPMEPVDSSSTEIEDTTDSTTTTTTTLETEEGPLE